MNRPQPAPELPAGYVEDEFFLAGSALSFDADAPPDDGHWSVKPGASAKYRTRVIVRRPTAAKFNGTVLVEWFNVSAVESGPDWAYLSEEIAREGMAYIGVSAQAQGVEGGETLLDVSVDEQTAASLGDSGDRSGLKHIDPARYGSLVHPGDAYAYDMFSQVGSAVKECAAALLSGLEPRLVLAVGESQSAAFMTTLVDAVHPLDPVFDGFLIHSRGGGAAPLDGKFDSDSIRQQAGRGIRIRTDLDVPVFMFETETDLTLLGYSHARQPDTQCIRTWEVAGTAHADSHLLTIIIGGPRDPNVGSLIGCDSPINVGLQHEVLQAALRGLVRWASGGDPPPSTAPLELVDPDSNEASIARDSHGNARGGVRNPFVDAPVATLSGEPSKGTTPADVEEPGGIGIIFGTTIPFDRSELVALYGSADDYVAAFRSSADEAVSGGFLLRPDADKLIAEAEANRALFG
jgi:hypothetical protein